MPFPGESIVLYFIQQLIEEVKNSKILADGVEGELHLLQSEIKLLGEFLREEERKHIHHGEVEPEIMNQTRGVIFDAEKVVDRYIYHAAMKKANRPGYFNRLDIAKDVEWIKTKIESIKQNRITYAPESGAQAQNSAEADDEADDDDLRNDTVGLDGEMINRRVEVLKDPNSQRYSLITGMGGLGKSKLAWNIYGSIADGEHFDCCLWVCGSRKFKARDWLLKILNQLQSQTGATASATDGNNGRNNKELAEALRRHLEDKKYLLVLDGMWDTEEWKKLEPKLPDNIMGSKILITCREDVITSEAKSQYWSVEPLKNGRSWDLLRKKVFRANEEPNYHLIVAGKELAAECNELPLSIIVLAEILLNAQEQRKHSYRTWRSYRHHVNYQLIRQQRCFRVLAESYKQLSGQLKPCFLYLALFSSSAAEEKEGFLIYAAQLKELWLAEGFIQDVDDESRHGCLRTLVNGNLVQVVSKRILGDTVKTFRVHSILRELSRYEGEREKFTELRFDNRKPSSKARGRRLSIQGDVFIHIFSSEYDSSSARSLFLFNQSTGTNFDETKFWERIGQSFMYVRVLYLWKVPIQTIPDGIENLILLKSITIWGDKKLKIKAVSDFLCKLVHVESINIDGHVSKCLPEIWNMDKLRHLRVSQGMSLPNPPPKGLKQAHNLRILSGVIVQENMAHSIFTNVEKLHLVYIAKRQNTQVDETQLVVGKARQKLEEEQKKLEALETAKNAQKNITRARENVMKAQKKVEKAEEKAEEAQKEQKAQEHELRTNALASIEKLDALQSLKIIGFEEFDVARDFKFPSTLEKITFVRSYLNLNYLIGFLQNLSNHTLILKVREHYGSESADELKSGIENRFPNIEVFIR